MGNFSKAWKFTEAQTSSRRVLEPAIRYNVGVRFLCGLFLAATISAQTQFIPLKDIRPGMKGVGKTVFAGARIEDFQVEILGILENIGPKQSLILARLSGGPLARTGVMQGMSGSPVYIDGRLAGALAMGFAFSKEPIAAIRPIEDMLRLETAGPRPPVRLAGPAGPGAKLTVLLPAREEVLAAGERMVDIATPISFGGFTRNTIEHFGPQLRSLGLEPRQGISGGGRPQTSSGPPGTIEPGAMITVQLISGDMSVGADGTVTYVDGNRILAFGHRFLSVGSTALPFSRAEVLTLLPNLASSFKISSARDWLGTITQDRSTGVAGEVGRPAGMIPVSISVTNRETASPAPVRYDLQVVNDRLLSPFLLQMAVFSAIDATERTTGESSYTITGEVEFQGGAAPLKLDNMYSGDFNPAAQVSLATAVPVAYVMQSGFDTLQLKRVALDVQSFPRKRQLQIDQLWPSRREVRPGETVDLRVVLAGENGLEVTRTASYRVPLGAPLGPLQFTAADAATINLTEYRQLLSTQPKSAGQLLSFMNGLRANNKVFIRVWRAEPAYEVQGEILPDPPPSVALLLSRSQPSLSATPALPNSRLAELEIGAGDMVISGSKTVQVEVKE